MNGFDDSGSRSVRDTLWYLVDWMDDIVLHETTQEGCAKFLHEGNAAHEIEASGVPGEIYSLCALVLYDDATARRADDGVWSLDPPQAETVSFAAVRRGPGDGWDEDALFDPQHINDGWGLDLFEDLADGGNEVSDIANGDHRYFKARFDVVAGVPQIILINEVTQAEALA